MGDPAGEFQVVEELARALGLEVHSLEARDHGALEAAFERVAAERVDGLVLIDTSLLAANAPRIAEFALRHRLPTMSGNRITVGAGGLMAYGADRPAMFRRAAGYVDRLLKGADPAEMPIERATTFDLVLNLKTARELGLTIPRPSSSRPPSSSSRPAAHECSPASAPGSTHQIRADKLLLSRQP